MNRPSEPKASLSPPAASDTGKIVLGAGYRLPAPKPAHVADQGKISVGAGYRLPSRHTV